MPSRRKRRRGDLSDSKKRSSPPLGEESSDDDLDVNDMIEDDDILDHRAFFFTRMRPEELLLKKKQKKHEDVAEPSTKRSKHAGHMTSDEEEQEYERVPRPSTWEQKGGDEKKGVHYLLPLKADRGRLIQQDPTHIQIKEEEEENVSETSLSPPDEHLEEAGDNCEERNKTLPKVLTAQELQEKITAKKESISSILSQLMENPEGNIGQLKVLRGLCVERNPDLAVTVRKRAMKTFVLVVKDIAPSYHIRELTDAEKAVKVSKDVKRVRHFEHTLLLDYQLFLSQCDETIKVGLHIKGGSEKKKRRERKKPVVLLEDDKELSQADMEGLGEVALKCLCELLEALPHFNFRNNILATVVPLMTSKALDGKVSQMCCSAIESVFRGDSVGEVSFEAVQLIARMVKSKSYKTKPAVLRTFLSLRLTDVDDPVSAVNSQSAAARTKLEKKKERKRELKLKMTKKQKRRLNAEEKLDRDLEETSAVESRQKKSKIQTEVLKVVFLTYFRILKHSRHSPLLQPVLEGLGKFAHLISIDFFADLMSILHSLAETGGLTNKECMQCVLTAFQILSGQGAALNVDPRQFHTQLYGALLQLDSSSASSDVLLAVNCLEKLLHNHRQISTQRVLGFVKRLSTMTLQLLPGAALPVLATIRKFIQSYSQCEQLLDVDAMAGSGVYRPDVPDPEMSCASSTSLWELADLRFHYDSTVSTYAHYLLYGAPSQGKWTLHPDLARKTPRQLLSDFSLHLDNGKVGEDSSASFDPMARIPHPPAHPALKLAQKKQKGLYYYSDQDIWSTAIKEQIDQALELADRSIIQLLPGQ